MMADITMCQGIKCPLKEHCYRHTALVNPHYQSFFVETPFKDGQCEYLIDTRKVKEQ